MTNNIIDYASDLIDEIIYLARESWMNDLDNTKEKLKKVIDEIGGAKRGEEGDVIQLVPYKGKKINNEAFSLVRTLTEKCIAFDRTRFRSGAKETKEKQNEYIESFLNVCEYIASLEERANK